MHNDLCRAAQALVQRVMETYLSGNAAAVADLMTSFAPDVLVIGAGKHEFYRGLKALAQGMERDQKEAAGVTFQVQDIWFEAQAITSEACVVYGELANAITGRVGGDEFLIFLPGVTDKPQGQATARRLRQGIDALEAPDLAPSCSIGITLAHGDQDTFHAAYKRADQALYQAKSHGKNGYCWYEDNIC